MLGQHVGFEIGQRRRVLARTQIGPDDAAALSGGIGVCFDLVPEVTFGGFIRHVDAGAIGGELPAVVDASEALLLVATEEQGGASVRAVVLDQADRSIGSPKADQIFAEQPYAQWVAVGPR